MPVTPVPAKKVTLSLTYAFNEYKVVSISNSTLFKPAEYLTETQVKEACGWPNWDITMIDPDIPGQVLNFIRGLIPL